MNWEFYSARRKITLEEFTKNASNLYEAKKIFESAGIDLPVDNSLSSLFEGTPDKPAEKDKPDEQGKAEERSASATSSWLATGNPNPKSSAALPKTSVDYLEMGVKPSKEEGSDDDKSSDAKS